MGQQQIEVSFSLGKKLILSIVLLLVVVITFLNISSILLFRKDKSAYTYQSQSTEVLLVSREFVSMSKHVLNTLKGILATVDPRSPVQPSQAATVKGLIQNQTDIIASRIQFIDTNTGKTQTYLETVQDELVKSLNIDLSKIKINETILKPLIPELLEQSYAFVNLTPMGESPLIGIIQADISLKDQAVGMPINIGILSLRDYGNDFGKLKLVIASRSGKVVFATDPVLGAANSSVFDNPLFQSALSSKVTTGAQEFDFKNVHYLGSFISTNMNLLVLTDTEWDKVMKSTYVLIEKFILMGAMSIGMAVIFAIFFSKTLTAPLEKLFEATREISSGNFLILLDAEGSDEISALSNSFNRMSRKISELVQASMEKVQLENELAIASIVQQTLLPPNHFQNEWLDIWSYYQSASSCGGDWWGFFGVGKKVAVMIADATGHGFPSALITASARSCFSVMHKLALEDPEFTFSPSAMLNYANRVVFDASLGRIMMTFFIGVLDFDKMTITYASAGHNPPWLFQKKSDGKYVLKSLTCVGERLGEGRDLKESEEKSHPINSGDLIFLYTDGLTEGKDKEGKMYGKKRAKNTVEANLSSGPEQLINTLIEDFLSHNSDKPLDDDVTVASILITSGNRLGTQDP